MNPVSTTATETIERSVTLPDGGRIVVRPLREDDREREIEFLNGLSERTRYLRLLTPLRFLPLHMVDQLMDVDGKQRVAFVATAMEAGLERFVGVARYVVAGAPQEAEVGITVTDAWHGRGVAMALLTRLIEHARGAGLKRLMGIVLPENYAMLALAKKVGFSVRLNTSERLMRISLDLS